MFAQLRCLLAFVIGQCLYSIVPAQSPAVIDLQGTWEFKAVDSENWFPATVPGTVHSDLMAVNLIPDPFVDLNETVVQWVEEKDWEYRKTISLTEQQLLFANGDLVFEGLDTYVDVFLNGELLGRCDNMHRQWEFPCKQLLKVGDNELLLRFLSPMRVALAAYQASPFPLSSGNDAAKVKVSPYVRKAAYQFGWDFAPRLVTAGVWRPVHLRLWDGVRIERIDVRTVSLTKFEAQMMAVLDVEVAEAGQYGIEIKTFAGVLDDTKGELHVSTHRKLELGKQRIFFQFSIWEPNIWWPRGMGEPFLYDLEVRIKHHKATLDLKRQKLGLRTVRLVREKDAIGTSFYFSINDSLPGGGPLYIKGANYVPADALLPRGHDRQMRLLEAAAAVGMNMLRVWGGGVYADDHFYEWCDAHGMLVWQDLAFACMMYPLEGDLLANATKEVRDNVYRLRHHPSLALWCGNNEIDVAWHNWGWQQEFKYSEEFSKQLWREYQGFFELAVPSLLAMDDPGRPWIASSPLSNWGREENFNHHNMHYWGVWHGTDSLDGFSKYVPRFMSEYGFQSWPAPATLRNYTQPEDWAIDSKVMLNRQKSYKGNAPILTFLRALYGEPKDFEAFVRLSQLVQRDAMTLAIEAHRMKSPHCMGTLYWQLNDCWPGPSWSTIDYDGVWKPAHYALKRLYAPLVIAAKTNNDSLYVQVFSEAFLSHVKFRVDFRSLGDSGIVQHFCATHIPKGLSESVYPIKDFHSDEIDPRNSKVVIDLYDGSKDIHKSQPIASKIFYFVAPKNLHLSKTAPQYSLVQEGQVFKLSLRSSHLIKDLHVEVAQTNAQFSDNFFDLSPREPRTIEIIAPEVKTIDELEALLRFSDLYSIMH